MSSGRIDIVIKALDGPLASFGEIRLKGPLAEIGVNPAPGGLKVPVRGLASTHVRICVRPDGQAEVVPVGQNQVRLAPHANVRWNLIEPLQAATLLNEGGVMRLGPVQRGVTLQLMRLEGLDWTAGGVGSVAREVKSQTISGAKTAGAPGAVRVVPAALGVGAVGCGLIGVCTALAVALLLLFPPTYRPTPLGIEDEGEEMYAAADLASSVWVSKPEALRGVEGAWQRFVSAPSAAAAEEIGVGRPEFNDVDHRDEKAFHYFVASGEKHVAARRFWRRLDIVKEEYASVLRRVREAGLPDAVAAIPFTESRYRPREQSFVCARGWWQFMPEVAVRTGLRVEQCQIQRVTGETVVWTPKAGAPARFKNSPYIDRTAAEPACAIQRCVTDEREDLDASTAAAIADLRRTWDDPTLRGSGMGVIATIISHNAGYDDSRFGRARKTNVLPAYQRWQQANPDAPSHHFYGANLTCAEDRSATGTCGGHLPAEAQRYGFTVLAQHWLAACYYGKNYPTAFGGVFESYEEPALDADGMCSLINVPLASEL
ncbi:MAG: transglycosylase SLT domain-containing protein [Myxococcota bacterium]